MLYAIVLIPRIARATTHSTINLGEIRSGGYFTSLRKAGEAVSWYANHISGYHYCLIEKQPDDDYKPKRWFFKLFRFGDKNVFREIDEPEYTKNITNFR